MLLALCKDADIHVEFNAEIVEVDPSRPCVTLSTGEEISPDIIVGADGCFSAVRQSILDDTDGNQQGVFTVYT